MYSIYYDEIKSYRTQLDEIQSQLESMDSKKVKNLTHFSLARSNRLNCMVVGLCALVEAYLYETAEKHPEFENSKDLNPNSDFEEIKKFLTDFNMINFSNLKSWDKFMSVRKIRHKIVHGYGGIIVEVFDSKFKKHFNKLGLNLKKHLIADRRIRFNSNGVKIVIDITENLLNEFQEQSPA